MARNGKQIVSQLDSIFSFFRFLLYTTRECAGPPLSIITVHTSFFLPPLLLSLQERQNTGRYWRKGEEGEPSLRPILLAFSASQISHTLLGEAL